MQQQFFQIMNDFQQSFLDSSKRFGLLNQRTIEVVLNKQQQAVKACYDSGQKNVQLLTQAKDPNSFMVLQSEFIKECGQAMVNSFHENNAMMDQVRNDWLGLMEESAEKTSNSFKKVTDLAVSA